MWPLVAAPFRGAQLNPRCQGADRADLRFSSRCTVTFLNIARGRLVLSTPGRRIQVLGGANVDGEVSSPRSTSHHLLAPHPLFNSPESQLRRRRSRSMLASACRAPLIGTGAAATDHPSSITLEARAAAVGPCFAVQELPGADRHTDPALVLDPLAMQHGRAPQGRSPRACIPRRKSAVQAFDRLASLRRRIGTLAPELRVYPPDGVRSATQAHDEREGR